MIELIIRLENNGEGERHLTKKADDISLTKAFGFEILARTIIFGAKPRQTRRM